MKPPTLSPVGSGLGVEENQAVDTFAGGAAGLSQSGFNEDTADLYKDQRITKVGDIVTVIIAINDKAALDNSTGRSQTGAEGVNLSWMFDNQSSSSSSSSSSSPSTASGALTSNSSNQGQGNIDRTEQIQVEVAAVVTQVLPNGNLMISGSQEVRVNFELRDLTVAGIIRPWDISPNNTISYDRIAEARISYGGRGRLTDVQQPSWGQQIYDNLKPF
jgi:flagellar L-ring protein FlgH